MRSVEVSEEGIPGLNRIGNAGEVDQRLLHHTPGHFRIGALIFPPPATGAALITEQAVINPHDASGMNSFGSTYGTVGRIGGNKAFG